MPLSTGDKLGPYEIVAPLGAGGMGEVYRARDAKLNRDVAIKVLPAALSADAQYMARFEREAQMLAAMNHPNIATVYGIEQGALVMELVEGADLKGPIPLDEALAIARQIAAGLEAAHDKGIIHRDLKPANIKLTPAGVVKILDFGLAKSAAESTAASGPNLTMSPTLSLEMTRAGMILGTAAYMSPEQARGKVVDKRTDIWAFGVVLYEIVTGKRLFQGEDLTETMASVVKDRPDLSDVPAKVRPLLERCLEKDPKKRLRDIGDMEWLLTEVPAQAVVAAPATGSSRIPWAVAAVFLLAAGGLAWIHFQETPPAERVLHYGIEAPEKTSVHSFALSPDGRLLAIAGARQGKTQLYLRRLDAFEAHTLPGTEGAIYPFWSPDSRFVAFFANGKLQKIAAGGGPPVTLCDAPGGRSGSWNRDDVIVFAPAPQGGLQKVSAAGGTPIDVTKFTQGSDRFPVFLPDGRHFLHLLTGAEDPGVFLASIDGPENRKVLADLTSVSYVPPLPGQPLGQLLFIRNSTLMAQPFDLQRFEPTGEAFPVVEKVSFGTNLNYAPMTASANGVLVYQENRTVANGEVVWLDRTGKPAGQVAPAATYAGVSLSPDEKYAAYSRYSPASNFSDLWLYEFARSTGLRSTSNPSNNTDAVWSPRGDRLAFASTRDKGVSNLFTQAVNGAGQDEPLFSNDHIKVPSSWSPDGRYLAYTDRDSKTKEDLWVLPMDVPDSGRKPIPFLQTEFNERQGQFSPDGHWMVYSSDESGRTEIYVRPFPVAPGLWKISTDGGEQPRWRRDSKEIFFLQPDGKLVAVAVKGTPGPKPTFEVGSAELLFEPRIRPEFSSGGRLQYDVAGNGQRFLVIRNSDPDAAEPLMVEVNWMPKGKGN